MSRHWFACRVCGKDHKNPMSSSICTSCGIIERQNKLEYERKSKENEIYSDIEYFLMLTDKEKWEQVYKFMKGIED